MVERGHFLDEALHNCFSREALSSPQKSLIHELASGVVRWKGYFDWVLSRCTKTRVESETRLLLLVGLYQVAFMRKADYHVVNETVEFAKKIKGRNIANFVNAILRRFLRDIEGKAIPAPGATQDDRSLTPSLLSTIYSFPQWLVDRWIARFGIIQVKELLTTMNKRPDFSLRVNLSFVDKDDTVKALEAQGIGVKPGTLLPDCLRVDRLGPVLKSRLISERLISVQDEASQLAGLAVQPRNGQAILDACAGMGTKTHQINDLCADAFLVAMDNDAGKLKFISDPRNVVAGDARNAPFNRNVFDTILLDAPCSSLGTIRKHPEIKWRRRERDIGAFAAGQMSMLQALWDKVKKGGKLVYSVCSFESEETVDLITKFAGERECVVENPLPFLFDKKYFISLPHETDMDGFFIAALIKP